MSRPQTKKSIKTLTSNRQTLDNKKFLVIIPAVIGFILYLPALKYGFVPNWDDGGYILNNPIIQTLSKDHIVEIFSTFYKGNYHPLTTLVYAFTFAISGTDPFLYHLINILLHTLNLVLVFVLIRRLFRDNWIAFWVALIFGVHPMHIESVAWISELKDVLYTSFYLLSLLAYQRYISSRDRLRTIFYFLSLLYFLFSLGSKSTAVTLSVLLFLIDWIERRGFSWALILEKLPFLLLSVIFGLVAMMSQGQQGAIQDLTPLYSAVERVFIVSYAGMVYVIKFLAPLSLSAMYPYPARINGTLPVEVYAALPAMILLLGLMAFSLRKSRAPVFGGAFFLITAALTLQIIPVGGAVVAERYTYVPYIGLSLIPLYFLSPRNGHRPFRFNWQNAITGIFTVFFIIVSIQRMPVWKDGISLFSDVISKHPNLPFAYNNRGYAYQTYYNNNDKALEDFNRAIAIDSTYHQSLSNRGVLFHNMGKYEDAITDFSKSLVYNPRNTDALIGRANTLSLQQKFQEAIPDYDAYLLYVPDHGQAWLWRGVAHYNTGQYEAALSDMTTCLQYMPSNDEAVFWKGLIHYALENPSEALTHLDQALQMNANRIQAWVWKGIILQSIASYNEAIAAYTKALALSPNDFSAYYNRAVCYDQTGEYKKAKEDLDKAISLGYPVNMSYYEELKTKIMLIGS